MTVFNYRAVFFQGLSLPVDNTTVIILPPIFAVVLIVVLIVGPACQFPPSACFLLMHVFGGSKL